MLVVGWCSMVAGWRLKLAVVVGVGDGGSMVLVVGCCWWSVGVVLVVGWC